MTCGAVPAAPDEVLRNMLRGLILVFGSIESAPTDYVRGVVFSDDVADNMVDNMHIAIACDIEC